MSESQGAGAPAPAAALSSEPNIPVSLVPPPLTLSTSSSAGSSSAPALSSPMASPPPTPDRLSLRPDKPTPRATKEPLRSPPLSPTTRTPTARTGGRVGERDTGSAPGIFPRGMLPFSPDRDRDRDRGGDRERERERDRGSDRERDRGGLRDRDRDRGGDRRRPERDRDRDGRGDRGGRGDRDRERDRERDAGRDKDRRDRDRDRDKPRDGGKDQKAQDKPADKEKEKDKDRKRAVMQPNQRPVLRLPSKNHAQSTQNAKDRHKDKDSHKDKDKQAKHKDKDKHTDAPAQAHTDTTVDTEAVQSEGDGEGETERVYHPLERSWTFWFDKRSKDKGVSFESSLKEIGRFSNIEYFWRYFYHLERSSKLDLNANYHLFKTGIKPMWEDGANRNGGKWILRLQPREKPMLDAYWLNLVLALIGEQLEDLGDQVCGAVVSRRRGGDRIAVWTKNKDDKENIMKLGHKIKEVVSDGMGGAPMFAMEYSFHEEALVLGSGYSTAAHYAL